MIEKSGDTAPAVDELALLSDIHIHQDPEGVDPARIVEGFWRLPPEICPVFRGGSGLREPREAT